MRRWLIASVMAVLACLHGAAWGASWPEVASKAKERAEAIRKEAQETLSAVQEEREVLLARMEALREAVAREEEALAEQKQDFESLAEKEREKLEALDAEQSEMELLEGILRGAAADAQALLASSPVTAERPGRLADLEPLLDKERFPDFGDIRNLVSLLFEEMEGSGRIATSSGTFIDEQGREVSGEILRIGAFGAYYKRSGEVGYLSYDQAQRSFVKVPQGPSWLRSRDMEAYYSGEDGEIPVDLSGGAVFEQLRTNRGFREWLESGGVLVWPILLVGFLALALILERAVFLGRLKTNTDDVLRRIQRLAPKKLWKECRELCASQSACPTCRVLRSGLENLGASKEALESTLQEAILKELPRIERFLSTLGVLAAVAPLLGLLGTVTGMINTFQVITVHGTGDPRMMSGGISEALVTTQLGLAVAVPIILAHHFLERRVDKVVADMEEKGTALTATLLRNGGVRSGLVDNAA